MSLEDDLKAAIEAVKREIESYAFHTHVFHLDALTHDGWYRCTDCFGAFYIKGGKISDPEQ